MRMIVYLWPDRNIFAMKLVSEHYTFLVHTYYVHSGYQTSIFGKNRAYYIQIFRIALSLVYIIMQLQFSAVPIFLFYLFLVGGQCSALIPFSHAHCATLINWLHSYLSDRLQRVQLRVLD